MTAAASTGSKISKAEIPEAPEILLGLLDRKSRNKKPAIAMATPTKTGRLRLKVPVLVSFMTLFFCAVPPSVYKALVPKVFSCYHSRIEPLDCDFTV